MSYFNKFLKIAFGLICLMTLFYSISKASFQDHGTVTVVKPSKAFLSKNDVIKSECEAAYRKKCLNLFKKLRNPDMSLFHMPPLKELPADLKKEFEQNGDMPITKTFYFNDVYKDSKSDDKSFYKQLEFKQYDGIDAIENGTKGFGTYGSTQFAPLLAKYKGQIKDSTMVVIGTILPWIEKFAYHLNASKITTLDYTRAKWNHLSFEWEHVNDFLDKAIAEEQIELFDNSASFSSIEHSGLGRYGDPLSATGDIDAVQETHCLLKPGGLFFLALPFSYAEKGRIEFNAHRIYGESRLRLLFNGWKEIERKDQAMGGHMGFVLKKENSC